MASTSQSASSLLSNPFTALSSSNSILSSLGIAPSSAPNGADVANASCKTELEQTQKKLEDANNALQSNNNDVNYLNKQIPSLQQQLDNVTGQSLAGGRIIYMDGSLDYIDFTVYQASGVAKNIQQGTADGSGTWFSAHLLTM